MTIDTQKLRDLIAKATPGPWTWKQIDDHRIREVLGYVEDAGPADVWSCARSWMAGRDAVLSGESQ